MGLTHFPNGISSLGMPVIGSGPMMTTGKVFFVDSGSVAGADATNNGLDPSTPFLTLGYAVDKCRYNKGDVIFLMPGHEEDITAVAREVWIRTEGISVIGLGSGSSRPRFDCQEVEAKFIVHGDGVTIANITVRPSAGETVTRGIDVLSNTADVRLLDIEILPGEAGDGTDDFLTAIDVRQNSDRCIIDGFKYSQHPSADGSKAAIQIWDNDRAHISNFWIEGSGTTWVAGIICTQTKVTRCLIENGMITCDAEPGIELFTGSTGSISNVTIFSDLDNIDDAVVADGCAHFNVQYVDSATESGTLVKTESIDD